MLLEESITYVGIALALHQMLHIWHVAKNVKSKVLGPQFHGNQDCVTMKVISRRMFVLARLQHILLMNVVMWKYLKYLAFVIIEVVNYTSGLTRNRIEDLLLEKEKNWIGTIVTQQQGLNSTHDWIRPKRTEREKINN